MNQIPPKMENPTVKPRGVAIILATFLMYAIAIEASETVDFQKNTLKRSHFPKKSVSDQPLILTSLIKSGDIIRARNHAKVNHPDFKGIESYSGYFTVNETCNSNMFFWYFPAVVDSKNAPVILWLQGGPGGSSLFGAMYENGPLRLLNNGLVLNANYSWNQHHNLLYFDNPVDAGYSFTSGKNCLATDETQVGRELYSALVQFFKLFPMPTNKLFLTGESYAGKYIPATAFTIHKKNPSADIKMNLQGIAIGDGLIDGLTQHRFSPYLYELGLVDEDGRKQLSRIETKLTKAIEANDWELATKYEERLISGKESSLFYELTGLNSYYNYISGDQLSSETLGNYFNRKDIKNALHAGNVDFVVTSEEVAKSLHLDFMKSVAPELVEILNNNYSVLLYHGQLDVCAAYPLTLDFLNQLEFNGKSEFKAAPRNIWKVDEEVAGYIKKGGSLTLALVRNAGHIVPAEQPKWMLDLLLSFTHPNQPNSMA